MRKYLTLSLFFLLTVITNAQFLLTGKVVDATSKEPLMNASVFCENTTTGTYTDQQGNFSLQLSPGGYNLIISYTGYKTQRMQVTGTAGKMNILMVREDTKLKEVVIKAKSNFVSDGWSSFGSYFMDNFIGTTPNAAYCSLLNREALRFYYYNKENKIKVFATAPLKIHNQALGYILTYQLDSFVYYFEDAIFSYRGTCLYTEMQGNEKEKKKWERNRQFAYEGSVLHFMRSYYNGTLLNDGWDIGIEEKEDAGTFDRVANPFDSIYYKQKKDSALIEVFYPKRIKITYLRKISEPEYFEKNNLAKNTKGQASAIDMKCSIIIKENGYYYDPLAWVSYNYWGWKNLADQLPYNYLPQH
jgi:hypothetical protein